MQGLQGRRRRGNNASTAAPRRNDCETGAGHEVGSRLRRAMLLKWLLNGPRRLLAGDRAHTARARTRRVMQERPVGTYLAASVLGGAPRPARYVCNVASLAPRDHKP